MSYDFRGPLTNLVLLIEFLKSALAKKDETETNQMLGTMQRSARSMITMINKLTELIRVRIDPNDQPEINNIEHILEEIKFTLKTQIFKSNAKITTHFEVAGLMFSRKNLRSILYNLLSNTIKFTAHNKTPEIFIKTEE